jgi:eukaryotic-like serine/threonine-protein kinase
MNNNDPLIGYVLGGRYTVDATAGQEQLGALYLAHEESGQRVLVKVLDPRHDRESAAFARFGREMCATAALEHPNVVRMLDFGQHKELFHYMVLEHVEGRALADRLRQGALGLDRAVGIAVQISRALEAAHAEGIVHRNLIAKNVLLLDGGEAKLRDFGMSRLLDERLAVDDEITDVGERVGAETHMAPEYIRSGLTVPAGDVYGLGILIYEMIVGGPPFIGSPTDVMQAHLYNEIAPIEGVPSWLTTLLSSMLQKDHERRPSISTVLTAMKAGMHSRPLPATPAPVPRHVRPMIVGEAGEEIEDEQEGMGILVLAVAAGVTVCLGIVVILMAVML